MVTSHTERNVDLYAAQSSTDDAERAFIADQRTKLETVVSLLSGVQPRAAVADVGAFTGYAASRFAAVDGVKEVTCFDLSPDALERARQRGLRTERWNADGERCPARDAWFDVVVACDIIEHLVDTEAFLAELKRICRPDGTLIMSTPNLTFWLNRVRVALGRVPWGYPGASSRRKVDPAVDLNHIRLSTMSEWRNILEACGWRVDRILTYSILDDLPRSPKNTTLHACDRVLRRTPSLAFGHIYVCRSER